MPIVRIAPKLVYFTHVPKCAGSAIGRYLTERFGPLAFLDRSYLSIPQARRWNRSSPQHVDAESLGRLFPPGFFDASFAMVRHPAERVVSAFRYQRDIEGKIAPDTRLPDFLASLPRRRNRFLLDNHFRPMAELVPEGARIFRLEDGTAPLVAWLDNLAGAEDGPREIMLQNTYDSHLARKKREAGPEPVVTGAEIRQIEARYGVDFDRFGYDRMEAS